ncbi:hypothetical protein GCM10027061_20830 [Nesterenkonia suensis]
MLVQLLSQSVDRGAGDPGVVAAAHVLPLGAADDRLICHGGQLVLVLGGPLSGGRRGPPDQGLLRGASGDQGGDPGDGLAVEPVPVRGWVEGEAHSALLSMLV